MIKQKMLTLSAVAHTLAGALAPIVVKLTEKAPIDSRAIAIMILGGLAGACAGLIAWLSTTYARATYDVTNKE